MIYLQKITLKFHNNVTNKFNKIVKITSMTKITNASVYDNNSNTTIREYKIIMNNLSN